MGGRANSCVRSTTESDSSAGGSLSTALLWLMFAINDERGAPAILFVWNSMVRVSLGACECASCVAEERITNQYQTEGTPNRSMNRSERNVRPPLPFYLCGCVPHSCWSEHSTLVW